VIAAATAIPGSATEAYSPEKYTRHDEGHPEYGQRGETPITDVHAQAVIADHEAQVDGVNPYTSEPVNQSPSHQRNVFVTPLIIPGTRAPVLANGISGGKSLGPQQQQNAAAINGTAAGVDANDINGGHYTNVGGAAPLSPDAIPRSEVQPDASGLQVLPGQGDAAMPVGDNNAVRAINDERAASTVTVSDLPMPGSFP
jgi:hypothetical protein